ncbi:Hypothetical protein PHPALM_36489 [Phytophthora palmivora]|uniref:Uncharacterized protein n=1 Tax=Phytophthora palmivora TaxID=4796 RepID=A0A2P4WZW0_9STRA|nr:Hypothetical protein PHPALM_36489 [Phytophthora palmivora]
MDKAMDNAAKNGYLDVVKWLHVNRTEGCTVDAMNEAAASGHLHVVRWLQQNRHEGCTAIALTRALMHAHFEVVLFLHAHVFEDFSFVGTTTVRHSCLELVQWLLYHYADKLAGCKFEIPTSDWRFNEWCAEINMRRLH